MLLDGQSFCSFAAWVFNLKQSWAPLFPVYGCALELHTRVFNDLLISAVLG